jgi:hypothetical protein
MATFVETPSDIGANYVALYSRNTYSLSVVHYDSSRAICQVCRLLAKLHCPEGIMHIELLSQFKYTTQEAGKHK